MIGDFSPPESDAQIEWALAYAAAGMAVFPVGANKKPITDRALGLEHGVKDATLNESVIKIWWTRWPHADAAWGIPAGIVVVDLDCKNGENGIQDFVEHEGAHPGEVATPQASSPTGGCHLIYAADGEAYRNGVRINGSAIDLRTIGGYIVLPGPNNGRAWVKALATPLAAVPEWVAPGLNAKARPQGEPRPFTAETPDARAALDRACAAIKESPRGAQEVTLNKQCFSIGGFVGAGELETETAIAALTAAANAMAAYAEPWRDLEQKVRRAVEEGTRKPREDRAERATDGLVWYGDEPPEPPQYLIDETLPEQGVAIVAGQWAGGKTFAGADLAAATIVGGEFAGKLVKRTGGCLWLAAEGETEIETRVHAAIAARGGNATQRQPFARQAGSVPCLTEKGAFERLKALAMQAAAHIRKNFNVALALITIDTLSAAAGFDDENSAAQTQKVLTIMAALAREMKALVILIDHYGKIADTGVRGSSAKSASADAILACLGDRDQTTGAISNRRLAVTKLRRGPTGRVIPFALAPTADRMTCTVNWQADTEPELSEEKGKPWSNTLVTFKQALDEALGAVGKLTRPRPGMPEVRAVDREAVREEFYRRYVADTPKAKRSAFLRATDDALRRRIMYSINIGPDLSKTIFWT